jgi:hypothetical protein
MSARQPESKHWAIERPRALIEQDSVMMVAGFFSFGGNQG